MHAHQSKAPRATLQHTHTYSTHSTAGTDQFIISVTISGDQSMSFTHADTGLS